MGKTFANKKLLALAAVVLLGMCAFGVPLAVQAMGGSHDAGAATAASFSVESQAATPSYDTPVKAGDTIHYTIKLKNTGGTATTQAGACVYIPAGTDYVSNSAKWSMGTKKGDGQYTQGTNGRYRVQWSGLQVPANNTITLEFNLKVTDAAEDGISVYFRYQESWRPAVSGGDPSKIASEIYHPVINPEILSGTTTTVYRTASPASGSKVTRGTSTITYTFTVKNTGAATAAYTQVRDYIPANTTFKSAGNGGVHVGNAGSDYVEWVVEDVAPNSEKSVSYTVSVDADAPTDYIQCSGRYQVYDKSPGSAGSISKEPDNKTDETIHYLDEYIAPALLSAKLTSNAAPGSQVQSGDRIDYTVTLENKGKMDIGVSEGKSKDDNNKGAGVRVYIPAGAEYDQGVTPSDGGSYDTASNSITWENLFVAAGATKSVTYSVTVLPETGGVSTMAAQALFANNWSGAADPVSATNIVQHVVNNETPVPKYEVSVDKTSNQASGSQVKKYSVDKEKGTITYTLTVSNTGTRTAPYVRVRDYVPEGTNYVDKSVSEGGMWSSSGGYVEWLLKDLKASEARTVSWTVTVRDNAPTLIGRVGYYEACDMYPGEPGSVAADPKNTTNLVQHSTDSRTTVPVILTATKTSNPTAGSAVNKGDKITYTITVRNDGGNNTTNIGICDYLPAGTSISGSPGNNGTYNSGKNRVEWTNLSAAATGGTVSVSFTVTVDDDAKTLVSNQAKFENGWVSGRTLDPISTTNVVAHDVPVEIPAVSGFTTTVKKSADPASGSTVVKGKEITYKVKAENTGDTTTPYTRIRDYIPEGTTYVKGSASNDGYYDQDGNYVEWIVQDLEVGSAAAQERSYKVTVNDDAQTWIDSYALYESTDSDPGQAGGGQDPRNKTNMLEHTTRAENTVRAILSASKTSDPTPGSTVLQDQEIQYTLTLSNDGGTDTKAGGLVDYVPAGAEFVSASDGGKCNKETGRIEWFGLPVAAQATKSVTFKVKVTAASGELRNQALYDDGRDQASTIDPASATNVVVLPIEEAAAPVHGDEVTVHMTADPGDGGYAAPGSTITYTLTAENTGTTTAKFVRIRDYLPGRTSYKSVADGGKWVDARGYAEWVIKDLEVGKPQSVSWSVVVDSDVPANSFISNIAYYEKTDGDPGAPGTLAADPASGTNTARHTTTQSYPTPVNLYASKSSTPTPGATVLKGQEFTYSITLTNAGGTATSSAAVADYVPEGAEFVSADNNGSYDSGTRRVVWTGQSVGAGATKTLSFKVRVGETASGELRNSALFEDDWTTASAADPASATNVVVLPIEAATEPVHGGEVTVRMTANPADGSYAAPGSTITYTLKAENTGDGTMPYVRIRDYVPARTSYKAVNDGGKWVEDKGYVEWVLKDLEVGKAQSVSWTVTVDADVPANAFVSNRGAYEALTTDPGTPGTLADDPTNGTNTVRHTTTESYKTPANLYASKTATPTPGSTVLKKQEVTYSITLTNAGGVATSSAAVVDYVPQGAEFVSVADGGSYDAATKRVVWTGQSVGANATKTVSFTVRVGETASGKVRNAALFEDGWTAASGADPASATNIVVLPIDPAPAPVSDGEVTVHITANPTDGSYAAPGSDITYTLTATNTGDQTAKFVRIRDYVPQTTSYKGVNDGGKWVEDKGYVEWVLKDLEVGKDQSVSWTVTVASDAPERTFIVNSGSYETSTTDPGTPGTVAADPASGTNTTRHTTTESYKTPANLYASKTSAPTPGSTVLKGQEIVYTITLTNAGGTATSDACVADYVPAGTELVSAGGGSYDSDTHRITWTGLPLAAYASRTLSFTVQVEATATGKVRNSALYEDGWDEGSGADPASVSNIVVLPIDPATEPVNGGDVTVRVTADPKDGSTAAPGSEITYTLTATNSGSTTAKFVRIRDYAPVRTTYKSAADGGKWVEDRGYAEWVIKDLEVGKDQSVSWTVTVDADAPENSFIPNRAVYEKSDGDPGSPGTLAADPANGTNTVRHTTTESYKTPANLYVQKTADPCAGSTVLKGQELTYVLTVSNTGATATDVAAVADYVPAGTSFVSADGGGVYDEETKRVTWTGIELDAFSSTVLSLVVKVDAKATGELRNAGLFEDGWDLDRAHDPVSSSNVVVFPIDDAASPLPSDDVTVRITADPKDGSTAAPGSDITYTLTATNSGSSTASFVRIRDYLPERTTFKGVADDGQWIEDRGYAEWIVKNLEVGKTQSVSWTVTVDADAPTNSFIVNSASYEKSADDPGAPGAIAGDPKYGTNTTRHTTTDDYKTPANLYVQKTSDPCAGSTVLKGQELTYVLTLSNVGGTATSTAGMADYVPEGTTFVSADGGGVYDEETNRVTWTGVSLDAFSSKTMSLVVKVNAKATGELRNAALYENDWTTDREQDPVSASNVVVFPVDPATEPINGGDVTVRITADPKDGSTAAPGSDITYTLTATNSGLTTAPFVRIRDYVPVRTTYKSVADGGQWIEDRGYVEWIVKDLEVGKDQSVSWTVTVDADAPTNSFIPNRATYEKSTDDPGSPGTLAADPANGTNTTRHTTTDDYKTPANLYVKKTADPCAGSTVLKGRTVTYVLTISNVGGTATDAAAMADYVPAGTEFVSADGDGVYDEATGRVSWTGIELDAYASKTFSLVVKVGAKSTGEVRNAVLFEDNWTTERNADPLNSSNVVVYSIDDAASPLPSDDVTVRITADPADGTTAAPGTDITYTLTATNSGDYTAKFVRIRNYLPARTTFKSVADGGQWIEDRGYAEWILKNLEVGKTQSVSWTVKVDADAPTNSYIVNSARYEKSTDDPGAPGTLAGDPKYDTNTTRHTTTEGYKTPANLYVAKTADPCAGSTVLKGQDLTFILTLSNVGGTATSTAAIADYVPDGTTFVWADNGGTLDEETGRVSWTGMSVDAFSTKTVSFMVTVNDKATGKVRNAALYEDGWTVERAHDPVSASNVVVFPVDPAPEPVQGGEVTVRMTANPADGECAAPGTSITYTLTAVNTGDAAVSYLRIRDYVPTRTSYQSVADDGKWVEDQGYVEWILTGLKVGEKNAQSVSWTVKVDADAPANSFIVNTARYETSATDPGTPGTIAADPKTGTNTTRHTTTEGYKTPANIYTTKSSTPVPGSTVLKGQEIAYTLKVENTGGTDTSKVVVVDDVPDQTEFVWVGDGGSYDEATGRITWSGVSVGAHSECTLSFTVKVASGATGKARNTALYENDPAEGATPASSTNIVVNPIEPDPGPVQGGEVTVRLTADPKDGSCAKAGTDITYTLTAVNTGVETAKYVRIRQYLPDHMLYKSLEAAKGTGAWLPDRGYAEWVVEDLQVGADKAQSVSWTVTVSEDTPDNTFLPAKALYETQTGDPGVPGTLDVDPKFSTNTTRHTTSEDYATPVNINATKTSDALPGVEVAKGDEITYTIEFVNNGGTATDIGGGTDYIPAGTTYVESSCEADNGRYNAVLNCVEWHDVHLDALGGTARVSFKVRVNDDTVGTVRNDMIFENGWDQGDPDSDNVTNTVVHPVKDAPQNKTGYALTVYASSDPASGGFVERGGTITYTYTAKNTGRDAVAFTRIRDYVPTGTSYKDATDGGYYNVDKKFVEWVIPDIAPNSSKTVSYTVAVDAESQTFIENTAFYDVFSDNPGTAGATGADPAKETNRIELSCDEAHTVPAILDVEKSSTSAPGSQVAAGNEIEYSLTLRNDGGVETTTAGLRDVVPSNTTYVKGSASDDGVYDKTRDCVEWTNLTVPAQSTKTVTFRVKVRADATDVVSNQALFANDWKGGANPGSFSNVVEHPLGKGPDPVTGYKATVKASAEPASGSYVEKGETITYSFEAKNTGVSDVAFVRIRDYVPSGTSFLSVGDDGYFNVEENWVEWVVSDLAPNTSQTVYYTVEVDEGADTYVDDCALYEQSDEDPGNAGATGTHPTRKANPLKHTTDETQPVPTLLDMDAGSNPDPGSSVKAGGTVTYSLTLRNNGGTDTDAAGVRDYLPEGTTYVKGSATDGGNYDGTKGCIDWSSLTVPARSSKSVSFAVTVDTETVDTLQNQGMFADGFTGGVNPQNKSNMVELAVEPAATDLLLKMASDPADGGDVAPGDVVTYTMTLTNSGDITAEDVGIRDYIPEGATYVEGSADLCGGVYNDSRRAVEWKDVDVEAGGQTQFTFKVKVDDELHVLEISNSALYEEGWDGKADPENTSNRVKLKTPVEEAAADAAGDGSGDGSSGDGSVNSGSASGGSAKTGQAALIAGLLALMAVLLMAFGVVKVRRDHAAGMAGAGRAARTTRATRVTRDGVHPLRRK